MRRDASDGNVRSPHSRPVSAALGTEFLDIDLRESQPPEVIEAIRSAFFATGLVLVRGQDLTFEQQERFSSYVGTPTKRVPKGLIPGTDELPTAEMYISNTRPEGYAREGSLLKHSDYCFVDDLLLGVGLYGEAVASAGGATIFVNAKLAADRLSDELHARLECLDVRHVYDLDGVEEGFKKYDIAGKPNALSYVRPALLKHPVTNETILYINELMTDRVVGLSPQDSAALLNEVYGVLDDPALRYDHTWAIGDVIVFDNIKLQHGRTEMPEGQRRSLRRLMLDIAS